MALFTAEGLRNRVTNELRKGALNESIAQKAQRLLSESLEEQRLFSASAKAFDIFLSHSSSDAILVAGLKLELEDLNYSVYVDWIEDAGLDRSRVTKETAFLLKERMRNSKSLIYFLRKFGQFQMDALGTWVF